MERSQFEGYRCIAARGRQITLTMLRSRVRQLLKEAPRITLGVSPERPHRDWRKRAGSPGP